MKLHKGLSRSWGRIQRSLFPWLEEELDPLTKTQQKFVMILEVIRIEEHLNEYHSFCRGRPPESRRSIARAFIAKMVYNMGSTRILLERLESDRSLRRLCGWDYQSQVPSESTFSRAYAEFSSSRLPERVHEALIQTSYAEEIVGHISRDSTPIHAREKPIKKEAKVKPKKKRGRPKKGEERTESKTRLEKQSSGMTLTAMLDDLPKCCDVGTKRNSKGHQNSWVGYKLHIDAADGNIPVSCLLTSASMHDSQAAIPMAKISAQRVRNLYDLMDAAYDAPQIHEYSRELGHVPIIDVNPRRDKERKKEIEQENKARARTHIKPAEVIRYNERSTVERVNGRLKDEFGGRHVRVRGHAKVMCHLMFGILSLTADQLMRMVQ